MTLHVASQEGCSSFLILHEGRILVFLWQRCVLGDRIVFTWGCLAHRPVILSPHSLLKVPSRRLPFHRTADHKCSRRQYFWWWLHYISIHTYRQAPWYYSTTIDQMTIWPSNKHSPLVLQWVSVAITQIHFLCDVTFIMYSLCPKRKLPVLFTRTPFGSHDWSFYCRTEQYHSYVVAMLLRSG